MKTLCGNTHGNKAIKFSTSKSYEITYVYYNYKTKRDTPRYMEGVLSTFNKLNVETDYGMRDYRWETEPNGHSYGEVSRPYIGDSGGYLVEEGSIMPHETRIVPRG